MSTLSNFPLVLAGKTGRNYSFELYSLNTSFNSVGGIYVFTVRKPSEIGKFHHDIIYIGKTNDLSSRFYDHHKMPCIEKNGANAIGVIQVGTEAERSRIEEDLLGNYNTKCNIQNN